MKFNYRYLLYIALGVILGYIVSNVDFASFKNIVPQSCTYNGQTYRDGEGFNDECNSCSCENGKISCTTMGCLEN